MTEKGWINNIIIPKLKSIKYNKKYRIDSGIRLIYASEIKDMKG